MEMTLVVVGLVNYNLFSIELACPREERVERHTGTECIAEWLFFARFTLEEIVKNTTFVCF